MSEYGVDNKNEAMQHINTTKRHDAASCIIDETFSTPRVNKSPHGKTKTYLDGVSGASEGSGGKNEDSREFHCFLGKVDQKMLERIVSAMQWLASWMDRRKEVVSSWKKSMK